MKPVNIYVRILIYDYVYDHINQLSNNGIGSSIHSVNNNNVWNFIRNPIWNSIDDYINKLNKIRNTNEIS